MITTLGTLFLHIFLISFLAFGGVQGVLPELYTQVVEIDHWMTAQSFRDYFAIAQAAPGPNLLIVTLIGWHVGGLVGAPITGAIVATVALCGTTSLLMYWAFKYLTKMKSTKIRSTIEGAAGPVAVGLVLASSWRLGEEINQNLLAYCLTFGTILIVMKSKIHPLWLILVGALAGLFFH
jgi:chromate transporter